MRAFEVMCLKMLWRAWVWPCPLLWVVVDVTGLISKPRGTNQRSSLMRREMTGLQLSSRLGKKCPAQVGSWPAGLVINKHSYVLSWRFAQWNEEANGRVVRTGQVQGQLYVQKQMRKWEIARITPEVSPCWEGCCRLWMGVRAFNFTGI